MALNWWQAVGGIVKEPEFRFLDSGIAICAFTLAIDEIGWDSEKREKKIDTGFFRVEAWGYLAERLAEMGLGKGDQVKVEGPWTQAVIEKRDGTKDSKSRCRAQVVTPIKVKGQPTTNDQAFRAATDRPASQTGGSWDSPAGSKAPF